MSPEAVGRKVEHLSVYLKDLREFKGCSFQKFQTNRYKVERLLELLVTVAIDVVFHLISKKEEPPTTYAGGFLRAGELKIISKPLAERLSKAAGLRNILAHGYEDIDPAIVHKSIDSALKDFAEFLKKVRSK